MLSIIFDEDSPEEAKVDKPNACLLFLNVGKVWMKINGILGPCNKYGD